MAKRGNGGYVSERAVLENINGLVSGLNAQMQRSPQFPAQIGRIYPGGGRVDGKDLCECAVNPTHCYRTVSQRSLSVPTRFASALVGAPNIPAGNDLFAALFTNATGALGNVQVPLQFNNADTQVQRQRIYDLVLIAVRAEVTVMLIDAEAVGAVGHVDISTLQKQIEDAALSMLELRVFHSADRNEPWIDRTNLSYFSAPKGMYKLVPPVMWIDRDPVMDIQLGPPEFVQGLINGAGAAYPGFISTARDIDGQALINIECLFVPDPYTCPEVWPGAICPRDMIGNTPDYKGKIASALRKLSSKG